MKISKSITLYTAAIGGAWLGSTIYSSQNTHIPGKYYLRGWMALTLIGGVSGFFLTNKYCPYAGGDGL